MPRWGDKIGEISEGIQLEEMGQLLGSLGRMGKQLKRNDLAGVHEQTKKWQEAQDEAENSFNVYLKGAAAVILMGIVVLLMVIVRKMNEHIRTHRF